MAANTNPIFPVKPVVSSVGITIANFAKGGTVAFGGTGASFTTVYTAGAEGSRIDQIKVRSMGINTAGTLRLFVNPGATYPHYLVHETTLAATGASLGTGISITAQTNSTNTFTSGVAHNLGIGQLVYFGLTAGITAVGQSTAYYVATIPSTTTFTLYTLTGSPITVGAAVASTGACLYTYTNLETAALTDYDITINKNTTETAAPIPYLPSYYRITATIGSIGATPANMGWEITVHGADY